MEFKEHVDKHKRQTTEEDVYDDIKIFHTVDLLEQCSDLINFDVVSSNIMRLEALCFKHQVNGIIHSDDRESVITTDVDHLLLLSKVEDDYNNKQQQKHLNDVFSSYKFFGKYYINPGMNKLMSESFVSKIMPNVVTSKAYLHCQHDDDSIMEMLDRRCKSITSDDDDEGFDDIQNERRSLWKQLLGDMNEIGLSKILVQFAMKHMKVEIKTDFEVMVLSFGIPTPKIGDLCIPYFLPSVVVVLLCRDNPELLVYIFKMLRSRIHEKLFELTSRTDLDEISISDQEHRALYMLLCSTISLMKLVEFMNALQAWLNDQIFIDTNNTDVQEHAAELF